MRNALPLALAAAAALLGACTWASLDAITVAGDAGPQRAGPGGPAADGAGDEAPASGASAGACSASGAATATAAATRQWTFDSNVEGWSLETDTGVPATLGWNASAGDPSPGALEADVTPAASDSGAVSGAWAAFIPSSPLDLSGRTLSAWVWLDSGESPNLKTFVQTGSQYDWADNGTVHLALHEWTCVSMPVSSPSYEQPSYDPSQVIRLGFEMLGREPFRLFIDSVRYQ